MAYDRIARQQQLSIAVASDTDIHPQKDRKAEKRTASSACIPITIAIAVIVRCVVALITRNASRRMV